MSPSRAALPAFWTFIVLGLMVSLAFGMAAIWRAAQAPLDSARDDFVLMQNRLIEDWIDFQLDSYVEGLRYLASKPLVISTAIGESMDNKGLSQLISQFDLLPSMTHIEVIDVLGERLAVRPVAPEWYGVYSGSELLDVANRQLGSADISVGNRLSNGQNIVLVTVPVLYSGNVEGAVVANFHLDVSATDFSDMGLQSATLIETRLMEEVPVSHGEILRSLDTPGVILKTHWNDDRLRASKKALIATLSQSLFVAMAVAFLGLGVFGHLMIAKQRRVLRRSHAELLASEQRASELAEVAENANDAVVIADRNGLVLWINRSMSALSGYGLEEMRGRAPGTLLQGPDTDPDDVVLLRDAVREARPVRTEVLNYTKSGDAYWVEIALTPVLEPNGDVRRFIAVERDITEQKQRRELEAQLHAARKLEAVGQLAAGIAHEINTPCQYVGDNIVFFADALDELTPVMEAVAQLVEAPSGAAPDAAVWADVKRLASEADLAFLMAELPDSIGQAREGVSRISEIVRAMKDFSHPGTEKQLIDLNRSVESCLTVSRSEWKYVAVPALSLAPELPRVRVSPGEINQVCVNIIVNAAHAIADRHDGQTGVQGQISVSTRQEGDTVVIEIGDNGCGMPEDVKDKIFNPFFTTKEVGRGTGQGLAIAHDIVVKRHGGALRVESEEGVGTRFLIELPLGQPDQVVPFEDAA
ncbi:MAG: ATP-binding protein [Pseudomonadota bacterium]